MRNNLASGNELTMIVSARAILSYLQLAPRNHEDWTQALKSAANAVEWMRVLSLAKSRNEERARQRENILQSLFSRSA